MAWQSNQEHGDASTAHECDLLEFVCELVTWNVVVHDLTMRERCSEHVVAHFASFYHQEGYQSGTYESERPCSETGHEVYETQEPLVRIREQPK